nr:hypothetical protein GCM10020185_79290 [Pseudomonas brassicacearum subsp. brassicacearum]
MPSYGTKLNDSPERVAQEWAYTSDVLQLDPPPAIGKPGATAAPAKPAAPREANPAADMAL